MTEMTKADVMLDCRGLLCPLPVIRTKQSVDKMTIGQVLEMTSTDPGSVADMNAWSRTTGHELVGQRQDSGLFIFYIRKSK